MGPKHRGSVSMCYYLSNRVISGSFRYHAVKARHIHVYLLSLHISLVWTTQHRKHNLYLDSQEAVFAASIKVITRKSARRWGQ